MATRRTSSNRRRTTRRPITRRASRGGSQWTPQEITFMRKYYRNNETAWVARQLGRTVYSVRYKASDLSIRKSRPSQWRGNTGVTKKSYTRKPAWRATSKRTRPTARKTKSRRFNTRKPKRRY